MIFDEFLRQVYPPPGMEWSKYRRGSARHRVEARIRELGLAGFASSLERLACDVVEVHALPDRMRVTVSRFFRETERWELLAAEVAPIYEYGIRDAEFAAEYGRRNTGEKIRDDATYVTL